jgi:membrane protease subunit HflK
MLPTKQLNAREWDPASESLAEALKLSLRILKWIMALLIILFLGSGIFMVEQHEVAMVLRFGKIQGTMADRILKPGLHWTWPYPLSEVVKLPMGRVHTMKLDGFWYREPLVASKGNQEKIPDTLDPETEGYCLTADANIIHSQWQVRYTISDAYLYLAKSNDPQTLLQNIVEETIVEAMAGFPIHDALGRSDDLRRLLHLKLQDKLNYLELGMEIQGLDIIQIAPARQTKDAFESVLRAEREQEKKIEEGKNYRTQLLNKAQAEASTLVAQANNYALEIQKEAESDARYFAMLCEEYRRHPEIFKEERYQKIAEEIHDKVQELFILHEQQQRELRIQLNRNPELYRVKPQLKED